MDSSALLDDDEDEPTEPFSSGAGTLNGPSAIMIPQQSQIPVYAAAAQAAMVPTAPYLSMAPQQPIYSSHVPTPAFAPGGGATVPPPAPPSSYVPAFTSNPNLAVALNTASAPFVTSMGGAYTLGAVPVSSTFVPTPGVIVASNVEPSLSSQLLAVDEHTALPATTVSLQPSLTFPYEQPDEEDVTAVMSNDEEDVTTTETPKQIKYHRCTFEVSGLRHVQYTVPAHQP